MFVEEMKKRRKIYNEVRINNNCEHVLDMKEVEKYFYDTKIAELKKLDPNRVAFIREWICNKIRAKITIYELKKIIEEKYLKT